MRKVNSEREENTDIYFVFAHRRAVAVARGSLQTETEHQIYILSIHSVFPINGMCVIIICGWFSFRAKLSISFRFRCLALCDCVTACCCVYANVCEDVSDDAYVGFAVCSFFFLFISSPFPFL